MLTTYTLSPALPCVLQSSEGSERAPGAGVFTQMNATLKKPYWEQLRDPRWQRKRLEIMERDKFACQECGETKKTLNVHHRLYLKGRSPWEYEGKDLITLCESCHEILERLKAALAARCSGVEKLRMALRLVMATEGEEPFPLMQFMGAVHNFCDKFENCCACEELDSKASAIGMHEAGNDLYRAMSEAYELAIHRAEENAKAVREFLAQMEVAK